MVTEEEVTAGGDNINPVVIDADDVDLAAHYRAGDGGHPSAGGGFYRNQAGIVLAFSIFLFLIMAFFCCSMSSISQGSIVSYLFEFSKESFSPNVTLAEQHEVVKGCLFSLVGDSEILGVNPDNEIPNLFSSSSGFLKPTVFSIASLLE